MSHIFICYRSEDSQLLTTRLFALLGQRFGKDCVVRCVNAIDLDENFAELIHERISGCDVLVALIGKGWLEAKDDEGQRRLDLPHDFVKAQIATALAKNKLVIPVLLEGAVMPSSEVLPKELASLNERNALPISESYFESDVARLIAVINNAVAEHPNLWKRLRKKSTQRTLAFYGAGVAAIVVAAWTGYVHFWPKQTPATPAVHSAEGVIISGAHVTATATGNVSVVSSGQLTIGITLNEYSEMVKQRERELREEFARTARTDQERISKLEQELASAHALLRLPEESWQSYKDVLANASRSLEKLKATLPAQELDEAQQALSRGDTHAAKRLFSSVLAEDKDRAGQAAFQLGKLALSQIDYANAAKHFAEAVALQPENPEYLIENGVIYLLLARYNDAERLLTQSLTILKRTIGSEHRYVALNLNNLGVVYFAKGLPAKAESYFIQSLELRKKALGLEDPEVAQSLNNLASVYLSKELYDKAELLYHESLAIRRKALDSKHPNIAESLHNLAGIYYLKGQFANAESLYLESLAIRRKSLASENPEVAQSLNNLGALYDAQGLYAKAEPLYQESLAIRKKAFGLEHPAVAMSLNNLAVLYDSQGLYINAEPLFLESITILKKSDPDHATLPMVLTNYAKLLLKLKRNEEAAELITQAKAIWKKHTADRSAVEIED